MSVQLTYRSTDGANQLVPIASERIFEEYWQPLAVDLGLAWVPLFQGGVPIAESDLPQVIREVSAILRHLETGDHAIDRETADHLKERASRLERELSELDGRAAQAAGCAKHRPVVD